MHHTKYFRKTIEKRGGIRQCSENTMSSFYNEHNFIIENPDNIVRIRVYSIHYVQSALFTTAVNVINIRHELGLDRFCLGSSNSLFKVVLVHLVYNSASCWSFLLHVVPNLICAHLVSSQLVVLPLLPQFLRSVCGEKRVR